jgi:hypothetical protein
MGEGHPGHGFRLSFRPRVHGENPAPRMARHSPAISACSQTPVAAGRRTGRVFPRRRSATDRVRLAQRKPPRTRCAGGFRATLADRTVATVPDSRPRYPYCRAAVTHARLREGLPQTPWIALQQDVHPDFDGSLGGARSGPAPAVVDLPSMGNRGPLPGGSVRAPKVAGSGRLWW